MASITGVPEHPPHHDGAETEPLLGRPGDAAQTNSMPYLKNLVLGTEYSPNHEQLGGRKASVDIDTS